MKKITTNKTTLYCDDHTMKRWGELSEFYGISRAAIARMLIDAAHEAFKTNGLSITPSRVEFASVGMKEDK